jgi:hypothetical protein
VSLDSVVVGVVVLLLLFDVRKLCDRKSLLRR